MTFRDMSQRQIYFFSSEIFLQVVSYFSYYHEKKSLLQLPYIKAWKWIIQSISIYKGKLFVETLYAFLPHNSLYYFILANSDKRNYINIIFFRWFFERKSVGFEYLFFARLQFFSRVFINFLSIIQKYRQRINFVACRLVDFIFSA